ncbi:glycosyltransferase family 39 protein [Streptomyces antimycoticus]|uniref:glycosyltransferase family 39 protein n=1 Tax=Streptomyces antimycoticus TaxID=68175 RepID=UPI001F3D09DB|nr:glycosyltransferase family 39 protein [Streptomyces antimycoticus]
MWRDESTTYQIAHRSVGEIGHLLGNADVAHGLYYLLMHAVFALWDGGLLALRLPSVLAMAATAAGVGLLGHRLAGPRAGLAAGLVFPLFPAVQRYAPEGRSYALVCAAVVVATHLLLSAVVRLRKRTWAGYAAVASLACLLHEFAILAVAAHGIELPAPRIRARMLTAGRIVTVNDPPGQPLDDTPQERVKREVLAEHFHRCAVRDVTGMRIVLYGRAGRC